MPVMENIRLSATNPWMKALFVVIVLVFVFWGIGTGGAPTNQVIAEVNGERITDSDVRRMLKTLKRGQSDEEQEQINDYVIQELIKDQVLIQEAERSQISVSDYEIDLQNKLNPRYQNKDGKFTEKRYQRGLKSQGITDGKNRTLIRIKLLKEKLEQAASSGIQVSDAQVRRQYLQSVTKVELKILTIPDAALLEDVEVEEGALDAFVTNNEADLRARYEKDYRRLYREPRRATLSKIVIHTEEAEEGDKQIEGEQIEGEQIEEEAPRTRLNKILAEARGGADFAELARTHSEDISKEMGGDLGTVAEEQLSKNEAEAVFVTQPGEITDIVVVKGGLAIIKVDELFDAEETPLDDVKLAIARTLTQERNVGPVSEAFSQKILDAWTADGEAPAEILTARNLFVRDTPSFAIGNPTFPGVRDSPALLSKLTHATGTGLIETVFPVPGARMIVEITAFERPDESTMAEVMGLAKAIFEQDKKKAFADAWVDDLVNKALVTRYD